MYQTVKYYVNWYQEYFLDCWANLGPSQYGMLLIGIGVFGWLLMKSGIRK